MNPRQSDGTEVSRSWNAHELLDRYRAIRNRSCEFVEPLEPEDCVVQSMNDVSPTRWHLAHTTWFFETFVLGRCQRNHRPYNPAFETLFNSYYNSVGNPFPRSRRGLLSRPTVKEVRDYRRQVDGQVEDLLLSDQPDDNVLEVIELGLNHEEQHLELMHTDRYRPVEGALGEYNGKFMCNQYVLRGGSCVTSRDHIRPTYRNFLPPDARWQFSGIRLAR